MKELTTEQARVLDFIIERQAQAETPSVREIAKHFGYRSPNSAGQHLRLIEQKGYIKRTRSKARTIEVLVRKPKELNRDTVEIPLVGTIAAGKPITAIENIDGMVALDRNLFGTEGLFCLRVKGDSMRDIGVLDGDMAIVRKQSSLDSGEVGAVIIDDEATLKRVVRRNNQILLRAENPAYEDMTLSSDRDVSIAGRLVGVLRKC